MWEQYKIEITKFVPTNETEEKIVNNCPIRNDKIEECPNECFLGCQIGLLYQQRKQNERRS